MVTRRKVQVALGALWVLDGALQLQPFMFTKGFADRVLAPAGQGQPAFVSLPIHWAAQLVGGHPVAIDALFASIQLLIGVGILLRPTVRLALAASVAWSLGVWYLGEGLGGLASGHAALLTGAPGAVLLYAVLAAACWPRPACGDAAGPGGPERRLLRLIGTGRRWSSAGAPAGWLALAWAVLWLGGATLRLLPGQGSNHAISSALSSNAGGAPTWIARADMTL
ncbi:MAG: hypothetical protein ACRDYD_05665, partial [Acidimicrobiales bacterium]